MYLLTFFNFLIKGFDLASCLRRIFFFFLKGSHRFDHLHSQSMSNSVPLAVSEPVGRFLKHVHTSSWSLWEHYRSNVKRFKKCWE